MRVLFISNYFPPNELGGAEVSALLSAMGLQNSGHSPIVFTTNARDQADTHTRYLARDIPVIKRTHKSDQKNPWHEFFDARIYGDVLAVLRETKPDIVHSHNLTGASLAPLLACRRMNVPVVQTLHDLWMLCPNNMMYRRDGSLCAIKTGQRRNCGACARHLEWWADIPARRIVFRLLANHIRYFIAPSHIFADLHCAAGYPRERLVVIPYGMPSEAMAPLDQPAAVRALATDHQSFTVVQAGSFMEHKGADSVIAALKVLAERWPAGKRWRWIVAGYIPPYYAQQLSNFPNVQQVQWIPFSQMRALYAYADALVQPSIWQENLPMSIIESLMAGTPAVVSKTGGMPEMVRQGVTGFLFERGNGQQLAETLLTMASMPRDQLQQLRRACRKYALENWSMDMHVECLLNVYRAACEH